METKDTSKLAIEFLLTDQSLKIYKKNWLEVKILEKDM